MTNLILLELNYIFALPYDVSKYIPSGTGMCLENILIHKHCSTLGYQLHEIYICVQNKGRCIEIYVM